MRFVLVVLAGLWVVHLGARAATDEHDGKVSGQQAGSRMPAKPGDDTGPLPAPVEEMRQALLAAAHTGNIDDLRVPLDWNEMKPEVGAPAGEDPIAYWRKTSGDGNGRDVLAAIANILAMRAAELPLGRDLENNTVYVWPYLAELALDKLTPAQEVDLLRLVSPAEAKTMREKKKWTWWRLTIGADGTWHSFKKAE